MSIGDSYATALIGLARRAHLKKDQTILVTAAAGGLGLAAVDIAANMCKAKVIIRFYISNMKKITQFICLRLLELVG